MKPEELLNYIDAQLKQGARRENLVSNLSAGGWSKEQIEQAIILHDKNLHKELRLKHHYLRKTFKILFWIVFILLLIAYVFFLIGGDYLNVSPVS